MIKVGQSWRNRAGHEVTVHAKPNARSFLISSTWGTYLVDTGGKCFNREMEGRSFDLVEKMSRVYIAGPMTGYPELNFPAFRAAAADYRRRGYFVINPAELNGGDNEPAKWAAMDASEKAAHYLRCLKVDINALTTCDTIVMLDGWTKSKGACLEHHIARELGFTVCYQPSEVTA